MPTKKRTQPKKETPTKVRLHKPKDDGKPRLFTLDVFVVSGPITEKFTKKNPVISRTIQIRSDQTLEQLHQAIFDAFGRFDEHMYEFQFGKGPMDPKALRYVLSVGSEMYEENPPAGRVDQTTIDSLDLEVGNRFGYWFDFGDDWWHQINVEAIEVKVPTGKFPRVTKRVGKDPPQYADEEEWSGTREGRIHNTCATHLLTISSRPTRQHRTRRPGTRVLNLAGKRAGFGAGIKCDHTLRAIVP